MVENQFGGGGGEKKRRKKKKRKSVRGKSKGKKKEKKEKKKRAFNFRCSEGKKVDRPRIKVGSRDQKMRVSSPSKR